MGMQRPAWTVLFFAVWGAIAVASVLMHVSVGTLVPAITDLPENLANGLLSLFGIGTMAAESVKIMVSTNSGLQMCEPTLTTSGPEGVNTDQEAWCTQWSTACANGDPAAMAYATTSADTATHTDAILAAYDASLSKFLTLSNDKYLGVDAFKKAGKTADDIRKAVTELKPHATGPCCGQIPLYCSLYDMGKEINGLTDEVMGGVDKLTDNDGIKLFNAYAGYLNGLHALPYIVVICMLFYTALWYKNGNWCCCSNGKMLPDFCCLILPQIVFWLVSFTIMMIFTVLGYGISVLFDWYQVQEFPGEPTIQAVIDHISITYVEFWELCFTSLLSGLWFFRTSTTIFFIVALFILLHSCCFCCCKPYKSESEDATKAEA